MRVDTALLCDWVTVRENLLHILGGGITRVWRDEFPAPLGASLALRFLLHPTETEASHGVRILLLDEDGKTVAAVEGNFGVGDKGATVPGEEVAVVIAMPMVNVGIEHEGAYSFEILVDGVHQSSVPFRVEPQVRS